MRIFLIAAWLVLLLPELALSQGALVEGTPSEEANPVGIATPQDDPGTCNLDAEKRILFVLPPKNFKAPTATTCSVTCKVSAPSESTEIGCDISAAPSTDGSICSRDFFATKGDLKAEPARLHCEGAAQ